MNTQSTNWQADFRSCIEQFSDDRLQAKLDKLKNDDPKRDELTAQYQPAAWLADAARRVAQIQAVTHVLKASHPDARGSSLHVSPVDLPQHAEIGSHLLGRDHAVDVVGNAAALDVYKFLKLEVDGKTLLDWMRADDAALQAALADDAELAQGWMRAFASLVRDDAKPVTHPLAKQLYWLTGEEPHDDGQYHLLQPMFSSTLAHAVHAEIQDARFGEANKAARQAFFKKQAADAVYRDYRGLVARKLGGTKPQNISQLNSERGGVNYLLASLPPPAWKPRKGRDLLKVDTVFADTSGAFGWFDEVPGLLRELTILYRNNSHAKSQRRKAVERTLGEALSLFGVAVRGRYEPGWTRDTACRLPLCEQLWLDPGRVDLPLRDDVDHPEWHEEDLAFCQAYELGDWADEVAGRFGLWFNGQLRRRSKDLLTLAGPEMRHFARQVVLEVAWPIPLQRRAAQEAI